jgi:hypothetical protein
MTKYYAEIYGSMEWFDIAEEPEIEDLPENFKKALDIKGSSAQKIIDLLKPYIASWFVPFAINNYEDLFLEEGLSETPALLINVVGMEYTSNSIIPLVKCEAQYIVEVTEFFNDEFNKDALQDWQERNGSIYDGLSFYWNIERNENTEDLDFTYGSHNGLDFTIKRVWKE